MMTPPRVSVLMPVYNGMKYLPQAVNSILSQSYGDFELVVVNDCSTDGSRAYLDSLSDLRINRIHLPVNRGVTGALQAGLDLVRGEFVARLDADDVAYPFRLAEQVAYMDRNPSVGLVASDADRINEQGELTSKARGTSKSEIDLRWELLFKNPIIHSTVLFRRQILVRHGLTYSKQHAEDYDLWVRMAEVTRLAQISLPLIQYRENYGSWTFSKLAEQVAGRNEVSTLAISSLTEIPEDSIERIRQWVRKGGQLNPSDIKYFNKLMGAFLVKNNQPRAKDFEKRLASFIRKRMGWRAWQSSFYRKLALTRTLKDLIN